MFFPGRFVFTNLEVSREFCRLGRVAPLGKNFLVLRRLLGDKRRARSNAPTA